VWRVYRLLINQQGVDDAAHLDQLLPVPAVASKGADGLARARRGQNGKFERPGRHTLLRAVNQELTKSLRRRLRDGSKAMQITGLRRHKLSAPWPITFSLHL
jgi:IS5 family transposase